MYISRQFLQWKLAKRLCNTFVYSPKAMAGWNSMALSAKLSLLHDFKKYTLLAVKRLMLQRKLKVPLKLRPYGAIQICLLLLL